MTMTMLDLADLMLACGVVGLVTRAWWLRRREEIRGRW